MSKPLSFYIAGLLTGVLVATAGFAVLSGGGLREDATIELKLGHSLDSAKADLILLDEDLPGSGRSRSEAASETQNQP